MKAPFNPFGDHSISRFSPPQTLHLVNISILPLDSCDFPLTSAERIYPGDLKEAEPRPLIQADLTLTGRNDLYHANNNTGT